ncbi:aquaporin [Lentithecium fluviatile CBS 122367]|uniref:Aquaporin n=1 Tax=Lentithecium fluviatile CBS 122367 TaxID=1168545 RepID=A0A6G1JPJ9_9PLEO|nr:aquaporin [Lentithecium fluviatile CBS 122367]
MFADHLAFALPFTKAANPNTIHDAENLRLPFSKRIPDGIRNHFIAMCGEYVGTVLFLYFALSGCQVANNIRSSAGLTVQDTGANPQQLQYIALSFGFSLAVNAWVFFRISGGLFNPAVTFGMCLIGALPWLRGVLLFVTQILGGITAAALVSAMFPGPLTVQTSLGGGTSIVQGLFIEMFLTGQLIFTIFMLAAEKHKGTFIAPVGIGLSLFVAELTGVYFTGGSLNPARSFGPAVVVRSFEGYHWIYWVGPILGAIVASGFYKFIKILEYESANPDQDAAEAHINEIKALQQAQAGETGPKSRAAEKRGGGWGWAEPSRRQESASEARDDARTRPAPIDQSPRTNKDTPAQPANRQLALFSLASSSHKTSPIASPAPEPAAPPPTPGTRPSS